MLSDPEKRKVYDRFGEEGLKGGFAPGGGSGAGFPGGGMHFHPRNAEDIFAEARSWYIRQPSQRGCKCRKCGWQCRRG